MSKIFYQFNQTTLTYDRIYVSLSQKIWVVFKQLIIGIGVGVLLFGIATYAFDSPHEKQLKKDNKLLLTQYEVLKRRIAENEKILSDLQQRDDLLYRAIFNADPIPEAIRRPGFGGTNRYENLMDMPNSDLVIATTRSLDIMTKELYAQSNSYDELIGLIKNKDERMKSIPAIVPISVKDKKQYSSGFGMRIHPLFGDWRMHTGLDITADAGTPIHATGDGVVEAASWEGGYGNRILINHGFGYESLYGHCKDMLVRPGQKVVRGQVIGTVGMTGIASGNHVHYEVLVKGKWDNPAKYFFMDLSPQDYDEVLYISENR
ncbi:MAG: M23 family metallopeptidase [Candidatus Azobacteroides sp.]|nr:M23 family metallopeptidase [Candidatus Azobacteroides sp.]